MKRFFTLTLCCLLLCSCSGNNRAETTTAKTEKTTTLTAETTVSTTASETTVSTTASETTVSTTTTAEKPAQYPNSIWDGELPEMDGSTSAIPLETGIKAKLLGISWTEAKELVNHNKTHIAFGNLLDGKTDLIFSVPISDKQQAQADEAGVSLTFTPVAKEGFVFVVNADNPVDSLTQEQLRAIYSGEIINWKELGGNDEPITAFQRNYDSGSQNYMTEFMGETPLAEAPKEFVAGTMGGILEEIASFDYGTGAIGYSVYSYAAQIYADRNEIKLVAIDGVKPTKATMADGSYPLSSCTYMITTDKASENTRNFVDWAVSEDGQKCVLESGYLPVSDMEIPSDYLPYEALGTGKKKPENFLPDLKYSYVRFENTDELLAALADDEFKAMVKEDIESLKSYFEKELGENESVVQSNSCRNGYLEVFFGIPYSSSGMGYIECKSVVYDIFEKKRIEKYSDLFFEGENYVPALNAAIQNRFDYGVTSIWPFEDTSVLKLEFSGYTGTPECFGINCILFNKRNPYSTTELEIYTGSSELNALTVVSAYRDMSECFTEGTEIYEYQHSWSDEYDFDYIEKDGFIYSVCKSIYHSEEEMAELNRKLMIIQQDRADFVSKYADSATLYSGFYKRLHQLDIYFDEKYVYFRIDSAMDPWDMVYDIETCQRLTPELVFGEDWESLLDKDIEYTEIWMPCMPWSLFEDGSYVFYIDYIDGNRMNMVFLHNPPENTQS